MLREANFFPTLSLLRLLMRTNHPPKPPPARTIPFANPLHLQLPSVFPHNERIYFTSSYYQHKFSEPFVVFLACYLFCTISGDAEVLCISFCCKYCYNNKMCYIDSLLIFKIRLLNKNTEYFLLTIFKHIYNFLHKVSPSATGSIEISTRLSL